MAFNTIKLIISSQNDHLSLKKKKNNKRMQFLWIFAFIFKKQKQTSITFHWLCCSKCRKLHVHCKWSMQSKPMHAWGRKRKELNVSERWVGVIEMSWFGECKLLVELQITWIIGILFLKNFSLSTKINWTSLWTLQFPAPTTAPTTAPPSALLGGMKLGQMMRRIGKRSKILVPTLRWNFFTGSKIFHWKCHSLNITMIVISRNYG